MATRFKLCIDKKGRKESGIYENPAGQKCLRIRKGDGSTIVSLITNSITKAIEYRDQRRVAKVSAGPRKGAGHRVTDLELNTLNNALRWAVRKQLLRTIPVSERAHDHTLKDAVHCRDYAVSFSDELHEVAGVLMSSKPSEVLGWQLLIEGLSGLRSEEAILLRTDALDGEPGFVKGNSLFVRRAEKASRDNRYAEVNEGLRAALAAHRIWHDTKYPLSPWYFPGRSKGDLKPVDNSVLTKALGRLLKSGKLKRKYTSHGGRAFQLCFLAGPG